MPEFHVNSNLTPREAVNVHGALPDSIIERLIAENEDHKEIDLSPVEDAIEHIMLAEEKMERFIDGDAAIADVKRALSLIQTAKRLLEGMEP